MSKEKMVNEQSVVPITPSKGSEAVIQYSHFTFLKSKVESEKERRLAEQQERAKNAPRYFSRQL